MEPREDRLFDLKFTAKADMIGILRGKDIHGEVFLVLLRLLLTFF
jgi:hypothetical protein